MPASVLREGHSPFYGANSVVSKDLGGSSSPTTSRLCTRRLDTKPDIVSESDHHKFSLCNRIICVCSINVCSWLVYKKQKQKPHVLTPYEMLLDLLGNVPPDKSSLSQTVI